MPQLTNEEYDLFIRRNWPSGVGDYRNSIKKIDLFFDAHIIPKIDEWDLCIEIEKKGAIIFEEQRVRQKVLSLLPLIRIKVDKNLMPDNSIDEILKNYELLIKNKSIMIFDDSINNGNTIKKVLGSVLKLKPKKVNVVTLICRDDALEYVQDELNSMRELEIVTFNSCTHESQENFSCNYSKKVKPYLESLCKPIQSEHPLLTLESSEDIDIDFLIEFFSQFGEFDRQEIDPSKNKLLSMFSDRYKCAIELNKSYLSQLEIIKDFEAKGYLELNDLVVKVRSYFRKESLGGKLILQPMVLEKFHEFPNQLDEPNSIREFDYKIKKYILMDLLIRKFLCDYLFSKGLEIHQLKIEL